MHVVFAVQQAAFRDRLEPGISRPRGEVQQVKNDE